MERSKTAFAEAKRSFSIKLVSSYVIDWVLVVAVGLVTIAIGNASPNKRPFSLADPSISFPYTENETVPSWLLVLVSDVIPVILILIVSLIFAPGPTVPRGTPQSLVWKRKLWELNASWLGFAVAIVLAFFSTYGMKQLFGRPRPDFLARCEPDVLNAEDYAVGGFAAESPYSRLYSAGICQQTDSDKLDDGFRSFPSGHSSASAAGLVYLSLFLASKLCVTIPFTPASLYESSSALATAAFPSRMTSSTDSQLSRRGYGAEGSPVDTLRDTHRGASHASSMLSIRRQAAAPPIYLLILVIVPIGTTIFISASRFYDYRHHGFDIIFGWLMGFVSAVVGYYFYHLPLRSGRGWAWGPRTSDRAFWAGVGRSGYVGEERSAAQGLANGFSGKKADVGETSSSHADPRVHPSVEESMSQRHFAQASGPFDDVEMQPTSETRV